MGSIENAELKTAAAVDGARLWRRQMAMARHGALPSGGVDRPALSPQDIAARRELTGWAEALGFAVMLDEIGNLYVRRAGRNGDAAPVLTGSHLDSQPRGGKFDGAYGVVAGLEALEAMEDAGITTHRPIELVAWCNEEGGRYQPGTMGSAVFAGDMTLEDALSVVDKDGIVLADALRRTLDAQPALARRRSGFPVAAYLEAHIEQGPVLEAAGVTLGAVTGVQGSRWFAVEVRGEEAHAGTTPRSSRRDAMVVATRIVNALYESTTDEDDLLRFTVGRFEVEPGSPNTVPGRVFFTIDLRHPEERVLETVTARIHEACEQHRGPCTLRVTMTSRVPPVRFDPGLVEMVVSSAGRLGLTCREMQSGAGHDAMFMAGLCPTAMLFVPCERGISHNEAERVNPEDLAAGARVLAACLARLAGC